MPKEVKQLKLKDMNQEQIMQRIEKNREEINNILFQEWPLDLIYMRIEMLSAQNEQLIEKLNLNKQ